MVLYPSYCLKSIHVTALECYALKLQRKKADGSFMKAVVSFHTITTDDTSGNLSKQYNLFDSYLVTPAAMSFDARCSKNNTYFICTSNKKLSAVDMLPALVDDLEQLESGVVMYSSVHKEGVFAVAPLLLIMADNYRHSELSMHTGSVAKCFCRKCLIRQTKNKNPKLRRNATNEARARHNARIPAVYAPVEHKHARRTLAQLRRLRDTPVGNALIAAMKDQGYGKNGSEELLRLKAYNPTSDTPIGLLHTVPLGIGKALLQFFWKDVLTKDQQPLLQAVLSKARSSPSYGRNFRASMNHNGCFVGRDFKQLTQVLPVLIRHTFTGITEGSPMDLSAKCFDSPGCLSSLLYMRNVEGSLFEYIHLVKHFTTELTNNLLLLDNCYVGLKKEQATVLSLLPKVHMLHHLTEDIVRFGLPVHYETEHGEQFNKFIREEILRTNRHNPSKDVATSFAKQFAIRHLINGGSFLVTTTGSDGAKETRRVMEVSYEIRRLKEEEPAFIDLVLGHRENADNNDYAEQARKTLQKDTTGYFNCSAPGYNVRFFGRIDRVTDDSAEYTMTFYDIEQFDPPVPSANPSRVPSSFLFPSWLTTKDNNIVLCQSGSRSVLASEIQLEHRLDMQSTIVVKNPFTSTDEERTLLNVHKYRSFPCYPYVMEIQIPLRFSTFFSVYFVSLCLYF
ncbi:hypothetical protein EDC96DRAFT_226949 [Choanephora cucurbitarum]|nr:hypothetical protein EDC96DRAFT_226949 [Choanephora cucurbitarum]